MARKLRVEYPGVIYLFTNQPGFVVHQGYDTNTFEFTTNWFQCFDIGLTNGDNIITLRAVDLAGNVTVTNYTYTFDTSDDTNAPVVQTLWPPAGLRLCGTNFTVRGTLDDETAVVTVSGLTPEPVAGLVERNGKFWVENLPLAAGTNAFTLAATDAAGNSNVLNLTVVQSDVELTIDPVPDDQLYQLTVDVSGVVGDASLVVWVNGVEAEVDGSGNWTAAAVPVNEGGTASFVATAYPANEAPDPALYGGTGMNPVTPNAENFSILEDKPARLYAIKDHIDWHTTYDSYTFDSGTGLSQTYFTAEDFVFNWAEGDGGVLTDTVSNWWANAGDSGWGTVKQQVNWPADTYIPSQNGDITSSVCDSNGCVAGAGTTGPPLDLVAGSACNVSYWDHCAVQIPDNTFQSGLTRNSDAMVKWCSGGKAVPGSMSLVSLWADVLKLDPKTGGPGGTGIPGHLVQAGVFGQLGDDGMAYKMLADGQPYDLTLRVAGTEFTPGSERYTRLVNPPTKHYLSLTANAVNLSTNTPEFCVGQQVTLSASWVPLLPIGTTTLWHWVISLDFVNRIVATNGQYSPYYLIDPNLLTNNPMSLWWYSGGNKYLWCQTTNIFSNGSTISETIGGQVAVYRPTLENFTNASPRTFMWLTPSINTLAYGDRSVGTNGMLWDVQINSKLDGRWAVTQIYKARHHVYPSILPDTINTLNTLAVDGDEYYNGEHPFHVRVPEASVVHLDDYPEISCPDYGAEILVSAAEDYVQFKPGYHGGNDGNIYVTLGVVRWNAHGQYERWPGNGWITNSTPAASPPDSSCDFPTWVTIVHSSGL